MFGAAGLDDDVVRLAAEGSRDEAERLADALLPQVRLMVMARLSPTPAQLHALEDLTQAAMTALIEALPRMQNRTVAGLKAFLSTVVSRKVADVLRRGDDAKAPRGRVVSLDSTVAELSAAGPLWQFISVSGTSPDSAAARTEQVQAVLMELARIKPGYRDVITMAFFDQLETAEIAARLNISRPAASMLLVRAIKTLRRNLTGSSRLGVVDDAS